MADSKASNQGFKKLPSIHTKGKDASRNRRHVKPQKAAPPPTPEQQAAILKALADAKAAAQVEQDRLLRLEKDLPTMGFRQLQGKLRNYMRAERAHPGLNIAEAICASITLENTQTKENPFGKLSSYIR